MSYLGSAATTLGKVGAFQLDNDLFPILAPSAHATRDDV